MKKAVHKSTESRLMRLLTESPCEEVPFNHFRNTIHRMRYDDITEFILLLARTFDWEQLSQIPTYAEFHQKVVKMNWMGIIQFSQIHVSESMVREFFSSIITDKKELFKDGYWAEITKDLFAHVCGKEVIITAELLGQMMNIEHLEGEVKPPRDFDFDAAWKFLNEDDQSLPILESERRLLKPDVKLAFQFIRNNIWLNQNDQDSNTEKGVWLLWCIWKESKVNLAQIIINEMKEIVVQSKMVYGFGPITTQFCSKESVENTNTNEEILKALKGLRNDIRDITRAQNKLTKESKAWRDEIVTLMIILTEKVTGKTFNNQAAKMVATETAIVNVSSSDDDEEENEEDKKSEEEEVDEEIEARTDGSGKDQAHVEESSSSSETSSEGTDIETNQNSSGTEEPSIEESTRKRARTKQADNDDTPSKKMKKP
ncbi:hypothetical protein COLO4_16081 [Corchorus olitorius]|uniref:Putative plant transposon protein domain-containing protein n=1 Tax=Corchorus olitorius TaxID=93759 RepID=A0A1R3JJN4_9ROSI|nr:hypothetical protein COLO4_16081 [Corchorus olitorius]